MKPRLRHIARDTGGEGVKLTELLAELELQDSADSIKDVIRKGDVSVNRQSIRDILYKLPKGSHVIALSNTPLVRVTVI